MHLFSYVYVRKILNNVPDSPSYLGAHTHSILHFALTVCERTYVLKIASLRMEVHFGLFSVAIKYELLVWLADTMM